MAPMTLYRHGDVLLQAVPVVPPSAAPQQGNVLVRGEATGHAHRIQDPRAARLFRHEGTLFLSVVAESASLVHEEHATIVLPRGDYRVWQQREYSPAAIRTVVD
jgi:hypothetical protein